MVIASAPETTSGGRTVDARFRTLQRVTILAFAAASIGFALAGPRVPVAGGLGWDGQTYAMMVTDVFANAARVPVHSLIRFLPSVVADTGLALAGVRAPTPSQIVAAFVAMNLLLMLGTLALWLRIARLGTFSPSVAWLGTMFLLLNYASLREPYFLPVTTDHFAVFLSTASLDAYLRGRRRVLALLTVAALFTWPTAGAVNLALLVLPPNRGAPPFSASSAVLKLDLVGRALAVPVYAALCVMFVYVKPERMPSGAVDVQLVHVPIAIALALAYVAWVAACVPAIAPLSLRHVSLRGAATAVALALAYVATRAFLQAYASDYVAVDLAALVRLAAIEPVVRPALFVAAHCVYWGPWILLFLAALPRIPEALRELPALHVCLLVFAVFFLFTESRWLAYFVPPMVFATCLVLERCGVVPRPGAAVALLAVTLVASRVWLPMPAGSYEDLFAWPAQSFFMQFGPWMSGRSYAYALLQTAVSALAVLVLLPLRNLRAAVSAGDPVRA